MVAVSLILLVGAAMRLVFFPLAPALTQGDSVDYLGPAHALLAGKGFPLPLERLPLYPLFVALMASLFGESLEHLVAIQHLLGLCTVGLSYASGRLTFGRGAGVLGGLAAALYGGLLMYEHAVMTEAFFTFLFMSAIVLYLLALRRGSWWCYAGCGLLVGLATLTRSQAQLILLLAPIGLAEHYRRWPPVLRGSVLILVAAALVLVPWTVRNNAVHGGYVLSGAVGKQLVHRTVSNKEFRFFDRSNSRDDADPQRRKVGEALQKHSDGLARVPPANVSLTKMLGQLKKDLKVSDVELDNMLRDTAIAAIREKPATYTRLVLEDTWKILAGAPQTLEYRLKRRDRSTGPAGGQVEFLIESSPDQQESLRLASQLVTFYQSPNFGLLVPALFFLGLLASLVVPGWRAALVPGVIVLSLAVASATITIGRFRYHYPTDPLMHVIAFGGILFLWRLIGAAWQQARGSIAGGVARRQPSTF